MKHPLWVPGEQRKREANLTCFAHAAASATGQSFDSYAALYDWSIRDLPEFWRAVWSFVDIRASTPFERVVDHLDRMPGARWFPGARLNFAENLLRYADRAIPTEAAKPALLFVDEAQHPRRMTFAELREAVAGVTASLRAEGVVAGDRVVGYLPNLPETVVAMLAAASLGATWAACAMDIGPAAALERLGQVAPKVLLTADGYRYKGKTFATLAQVAQVARGIPSLRRVVVVEHLQEKPALDGIPHACRYDDYRARGADLVFEQLPFEHPLTIMFSSGTTGKPKCLVQSAGGVLINHLKELALHADLRRGDRIFYITSCSWMMWNWLVSSLAVGATVVLYEGNPSYPDAGAMWRLVQDERINLFGCSASYLHFLAKEGYSPRRHHDLAHLRTLLQTGSPLSAEGFEYVYREIKQDLHFNSISGGTDINGCFAAGCPWLPVYAGELQAPALGMKVKAYDEHGRAVVDQQGELVCEAPSPSMPLHFWNDPDGSKYHDAYFGVYPGVWRHGDYVQFHSDTGGITIYGRSDAVLKPSGVRIGTAEIYAQLEKLPELADSLAVGQQYHGDERIILFVKLAPGQELTAELAEKIRTTLRTNASPRHVPARILAAPEIPYTLNLKKVESAVTNLLNGRAVTNKDALINPDCLEFFANTRAELAEN